MIIIYMLSWWYSRGWGWAARSVFSRLREINDAFSIPILLRTWFSPWKQIQTQATFRNFIQTSIDNLISRFVGATVRTGMIFGAAAASIFIVITGVITTVIWPVLPAMVVILPILFLTGTSL